MRINEIFYSLQGEGHHVGTPALFIRMAGCNLRCPFCDTHHQEGQEMDEETVAAHAAACPATLVVITGGEPALQLTATLVDRLHKAGKKVAVETNGTKPLPDNVDWITLSPKDLFLGNEAAPVISTAHELKVVFDGIHEPQSYPHINILHDRFLQPCDTGDTHNNSAIVKQTIDYIKKHPQWRLSMQMHKIVGIQ